ncbi:MAG: hypothetical protein AB8B69_03835 [Chitinophagales bacterium]
MLKKIAFLLLAASLTFSVGCNRSTCPKMDQGQLEMSKKKHKTTSGLLSPKAYKKKKKR